MPYQKEVAKDPLTHTLIGLAIDVHKEIGPHQPEHIYRDALCILLEKNGIPFEVEAKVPIMFRGKKLGDGYVDILVPNEVVLELKAVKKTTEDHFNQLGRNVRLANATRGLLLNFGEPTLSTRRWVNGYEPASAADRAKARKRENAEDAEGAETEEAVKR